MVESSTKGFLVPIDDPMGSPPLQLWSRMNSSVWRLPLSTDNEDYRRIRLLLRLLDDQSHDGVDSSYTAMVASLEYYCKSLSMPGNLPTSYHRLFQDIYHCPDAFKVERKRLRPIDKRHLDEVMSSAIEELAVLRGSYGDRHRADQEDDGFDVERDPSTRATQIADETSGGPRTRAYALPGVCGSSFAQIV
jgi:hypothetical protein